MTTEAFKPFEHELKRAGAAPIVVDTFRHYYEQLRAGHSGQIGESDIDPVESLPDTDDLRGMAARGREALAHTAVVKLNGGLGTSMGLDRAKSLLVARDDLTFLDVIARQVLSLRKRTGCAVPLIFMNSFTTDADTREALAAYPDLAIEGVPLVFQQNKVLKVLEDDHGLPAGEHAWMPPGHGDLYTALEGSGTLRCLLDRGYHYAFVSNADNLGATLDLDILGYIAEERVPFLMEVADRTESDKKGGHLARRKRDNRFILREIAQTPADDLEIFQNIQRHRFFNTNNIWIDLRALRALLDESGGIFRLPLIRNRKTLNPRDSSSPAVIQLETAMGAAIELFEGAQAMRVPRSRFAPVKVCADLLVLWSDAYQLRDDFIVACTSEAPPVVHLDNHYKHIDDLRKHFPYGPPSLRHCESLEVRGDVTFGRAVIVRGRCKVVAATSATVADQTLLEGDVTL